MKLRNLFYLLLALPLVFAACEKGSEDVDKAPEYKAELKLTSEATMEVAAEAGDYEITYTAKMVEVTREAAPATVSAECEADWVTIGEVTDAKAAFSVAANDGEARETKVVVKYDTESFEVAVKQAAKEQGEEPEKPAEPVTFEAVAFGGVYTSGAEEEMDVDNWFFTLTDKPFTAEGDVDPTANVYAVDLYLAAYEGEWSETMTLPAGEYTLNTEDNTAAGTFTSTYSCYMAAGAEPAFFEAGKLVVTEAGLTLTVTIEGVEHTVTYEGAMTLINDSEQPEPPFEGTVIEVAHAYATYNGDTYAPGVADNYYFFLSNADMVNDGFWVADTEYFRFDLYTALLAEGETPAIPYGTYTLDMDDTCAVGTISYSYSAYYKIDAYGDDYEFVEYLDAATVTVSEDGIVAEFTVGEESYKVVFAGEVAIEDMSGSGGDENEIYSTLTEDVVINLTGATFYIEEYYDYYEVGAQNYMVYVYEDFENESGAYLQFDILTDGTTTGIAGTYSGDSFYEDYTFLNGYGNSDSDGSWYLNEDIGDMAPLMGGTITIAIAEDGTHTLTLNCVDDAENAITGTIVGKLYGADEGGNEGGEDGGETGGDEGGNEGGEDGGVVNVNVIKCQSYGGEGWYELVFHIAMLDGSEGYWGVHFSLIDSNINNNLPDGTYSIVGGSINPEYSIHDEWNDYDGKCAMSSATLEVSGGSAAEKTFTATWTPNNGSNKTYSFTWTGAY